MRKMRMEVEALDVQSFEMGGTPGAGTVRGHVDDGSFVNTCVQSCGPFCTNGTFDPNGCGGGTAGGNSCAYNCTVGYTNCGQITCGSTCAWSCGTNCPPPRSTYEGSCMLCPP